MTERPPLVYSLLCAYVPFSLYGFRHPGVVVVFVVARVLSGLLVIDAPSSKVSRNKIKLPPPAASPLHLASDAGVPPPYRPRSGRRGSISGSLLADLHSGGCSDALAPIWVVASSLSLNVLLCYHLHLVVAVSDADVIPGSTLYFGGCSDALTRACRRGTP
jgi:hypothetical protein